MRGVGLSAPRSLAALMLLLAPPLPSIALAAPSVRAASAGPTLRFTGYVVDQAAILTSEERSRLSRRLGRFQRTTGHQLAVVTVNSLAGEDVATFTTRLAKRWGVGRKGIDDGIVILLAPHDHAARIATGRGLERRLPDAVCKRIMGTVIVPHLVRGHYDRALESGAAAIIRRLSFPSDSSRSP